MTHNSIPECSPRFLAVLCERCSPKDRESICPVCEGKRFYRWDPATGYCFTYDYEPLFVENAQGDIVQLIRRRPSVEDGELPVEEMLRRLGEWALEDEKRKFKLWFEGGWNAYLSLNKLKGTNVQIENESLEHCVKECFKKVFQARKRSSPKSKRGS